MYFTDCPASRRCSTEDGDKLGLAGGGADNNNDGGGGGGEGGGGAGGGVGGGGGEGGFLTKLFGGGKKGKSSKRSGAGSDSGGVDDGGPGEMGRPVYIAKDEQTLMREKFKLNQFNIMASDKIRLNRTLPDVRMEG